MRFISEEVVNRSLQTAGRKRKRGEEKTAAVDNGAIAVENADTVLMMMTMTPLSSSEAFEDTKRR